MKDMSHIERYERILNESEALIDDMKRVLERLSEHEDEYKELMEWYGSDEWRKDFEDDEKGLIPENVRRGVLSEDGIWNHSEERREVALMMMEAALEMMKS